MTTTRALRGRLLASLVAVALLLLAAPAPSSAHVAPATAASDEADTLKTVYFDMFAQQRVKPRRIFLSANAGQYLKRLRWSDWGSATTTAAGTFVSDCASCPPPEKRGAEVRMKRLRSCTKKGVQTYRKIVVTLSEPSEGNDVVRFTLPGGCP
ncbi:hypothetical protein JOE61_002247 [Nocardioides salarius]|uniref:Uncharacterized protein n=1 Tax=Nocardioides salarius TaxID=374513 RepID=A0ABS2MB71_9ACTN|nr:hypothetical protein [Nocardioides salarius]MBM7508433.1 hypothetical protein [Nocardioides salarius]